MARQYNKQNIPADFKCDVVRNVHLPDFKIYFDPSVTEVEYVYASSQAVFINNV